MANYEIVEQDVEMGINSPSPLLSRSQTCERDTEEPSSDIESTASTTPSSQLPTWSEPLFRAICDDDYEAFKEIVDSVPEAIHGRIGSYQDTPLVAAIRYGENMRIIGYLLNLMPSKKLVYSKEETMEWDRSKSAIHWAAVNGNYSAAKLLIARYPPMLTTLTYHGKTPIQSAFNVGNTEMAYYLVKLASTRVEDPQVELTLTKDLEYAIKERKYDFAYILIQHFPKLAQQFSPWKVLIEECIDLPYRSELNMWQSIVYPRIHMDKDTVLKSLTGEWETANGRFISPTSPEIQSPQLGDSQASLFKSVGALKLKHRQALELVRELCAKIYELSDEDCPDSVRPVFFCAVHNGLSDIVEIILKRFPHAKECKDDEENNALQYAISHRDGKTFDVVDTTFTLSTHDITSCLDNRNNNLLHLVAKKARRNRLGTGSEKVLQLQREFQWYKEMEKKLPSHLKFQKNKDHQVPLEVFDEEHKDMLKSESEWLTSMSNSCMVAGSLIAAVVFAAAITLPGGNNDDDGLPKFSKDWAFQVFAFSIAFVLVFSLTTVMTFLSIFITRYSVESFQYNLPNRLIIGLISLFLSVTFLMMSFIATVYLLFAEHYKWIVYPTVVVSFIPVLFSFYLQLPSLLNIIKSTYGHDIYEDDNVTVLDKP